MPRRANPDRILSHLTCRRESADVYRVVHGESRTAYVVTRNRNEPWGHPEAWTLHYRPTDYPTVDERMDAYAGSRGGMMRQVAEHIANVAPIAKVAGW